MLPAGVKFGVLPALNLKARASEGTHRNGRDVQGQASEAPDHPGTTRRRSRCTGARRRSPPPPKFVGRPTPRTRPSWSGSPRRTSPSASRSTPTCSPGTSTGTRRWTRATRRSGSGSSAAGSTPRTTASTGTRRADRNKTAIIFVPELETEEPMHITYQELYRRVNEFAALLRDFCGLKPATGVTLHMPMVRRAAGDDAGLRPAGRRSTPRCSAGSPAPPAAAASRTPRAGSSITMDGYYRNGELTDHKVKADEAVDAARQGRRRWSTRCWSGGGTRASTRRKTPDGRGPRLLRRRDPAAVSQDEEVEPVSMPAEAPLFLMYSSGTTGQARRAASTAPAATWPTWPARRSTTRTSIPRTRTGAWPTSAGSPATPTSSTGPLALGTTTVIYEGVPELSRRRAAVADRRASSG